MEIARLALVIAEYQANVLYLGEQQARLVFLPLSSDNWITCGNALRLDWLTVCPPEGGAVTRRSNDLFQDELEQTGIDFENEGGETYICGNPPYKGSKGQDETQKSDLQAVFASAPNVWRSLDYVTGWFMKAAEYSNASEVVAAFVATNSVCQGIQAPALWPLVYRRGLQIQFAHSSFKWSNLAGHNAGVTVIIVGFANSGMLPKRIYSVSANEVTSSKVVERINCYLVSGSDIVIQPLRSSASGLAYMDLGNMPKDGGHLLLSNYEALQAVSSDKGIAKFIFNFVGSQEFVKGIMRRCIWIEDHQMEEATAKPFLYERFEKVREMRLASDA